MSFFFFTSLFLLSLRVILDQQHRRCNLYLLELCVPIDRCLSDHEGDRRCEDVRRIVSRKDFVSIQLNRADVVPTLDWFHEGNRSEQQRFDDEREKKSFT